MNLPVFHSALYKSAPLLFRRVAYAAASLALMLTILAFLLIDKTPWVWQKASDSQHYFAATRNILRNTATPPEQAKDKVRSIALSDEDLTAMANFVLLRKNLRGFAKAYINDQRLDILVSVKLPVRFADYYLNMKLSADDPGQGAFIKQVKAGAIALPKPLARGLGWWLMHTTNLGRYILLTAPLVQDVRIAEGRLQVTLNWDREIMGQAQDLVADLADKERLRVYHAKLAELVGQPQFKRFIGMGSLIRPLFALAKERSEAEGGDPQEENRALILVLASYANGKNLGPAIYPDGGAPDLAKREILLSHRIDSAQHFTASAVLTISGHRACADMVGLAKEFNDTHGGSGFSFVDLAADRAGVLFGKKAVASEESARRVQEILSQTADESAFMPNIRDLPENLGAEDFAKQFGDTDSPQFQELKNKIEERIAARPLYR